MAKKIISGKIIPSKHIKNCVECDDNIHDYCYHESLEVEKRVNNDDYDDGFPEWCPLEDYKDESE